MPARRDGKAGRERPFLGLRGVVAQKPASQIDRRGAGIEQLDPVFVLAISGLAGEVGSGDLIDDDLRGQVFLK